MNARSFGARAGTSCGRSYGHLDAPDGFSEPLANSDMLALCSERSFGAGAVASRELSYDLLDAICTVSELAPNLDSHRTRTELRTTTLFHSGLGKRGQT